jgi:deoxyribodipyrimidine photo-lyase
VPPHVPASRLRILNDRPVDGSGDYVLYWMIAARRVRFNFALQRAVDWCVELGKPLLVIEALDVDYPWASDRLHRFVLDGMAVNQKACETSAATYFPYVERVPGEGRGLLHALSASAAIVVTDHYPAFFIPRIVRAAAAASAVRTEAVDSNGLIPLTAQGGPFTSARSYRAFVQRELRGHLREFAEERPLRRLPRTSARAAIPPRVERRWPGADLAALRSGAGLAGYPIDHSVAPVAAGGGERAAGRRLSAFVSGQLARYADEHNHPDADGTSRLSPYLHFGHISAHEVFSAVMTAERWTTRRLAARGGGAREGWWGVSASANQFLDQLVVWRELAFNGCEWVPDYMAYDSLPQWARDTLAAHASNDRRHYDLATLDAAETGDAVWNAAQRQLKAEGWFHGYLRMLWGKKLLEWAPDPATALAWMEALMNRYSLDGRDPVSYASFTWVLGRYDRPWPPHPVFGTVRAMTSGSAKRKLRMKAYLDKYGC